MRNRRNRIKPFVLGLLILAASACNRNAKFPTEIGQLRSAPPNIKTVEFDIPRDIYKETLKAPARIEKMRVVPLVPRSDQASGIPEYRLFAISPDSPAYLLGLRDGDVLVAANDYVVYDARKFKTYLQLLQSVETAQIEVRRGDEAILFKYVFK